MTVHPAMRKHLQKLRTAAQIVAWQERLAVAEPRAGWHRRALCAGLEHDVMIPDAQADMAQAVEVCQGCPVRLDCAGAARIEEAEKPAYIFGIRAGLIPSQRRAVYETHYRRRPK